MAGGEYREVCQREKHNSLRELQIYGASFCTLCPAIKKFRTFKEFNKATTHFP
jgi:hypothetical protein